MVELLTYAYLDRVQPGIMYVERSAGVLEIHSFDQGAVPEAGNAILSRLGMTTQDRLTPRLVGLETIENICDFQCRLINRMRHGNTILPGETLLTIETHPASYAALAANEAEVLEAKSAVEKAMSSIDGRPNTK